jgi:MarR family transcriptional regulator, lower aerobic nicotinate degradation pathway regulator
MSPNDRRLILTPIPGERDLGLVDALAQLSFAVQGALGRIAAEHGLSTIQARVLGILRDRRPSITELAAFLGLDKSSVTGLVDRAEERGLVTRIPSPLDGRSVQVAITPAGRKLVSQATGSFMAEIAGLVAVLTPEQQGRLSDLASIVIVADARRRGIELFDTAVATQLGG